MWVQLNRYLSSIDTRPLLLMASHRAHVLHLGTAYLSLSKSTLATGANHADCWQGYAESKEANANIAKKMGVNDLQNNHNDIILCFRDINRLVIISLDQDICRLVDGCRKTYKLASQQRVRDQKISRTEEAN